MQERYPRSPAQGRSRTGRAPVGSTIAFAVIGLLAGGGTSRAKPPAQPAPVAPEAPAAAKQAAPASGGLSVVEGGRFVSQTTPERARRDGLTVVDLSDGWLPYIFSETADKPQPLRSDLIAMANGRRPRGSTFARAREDRYFEAFGVFPSLNLLRRRLADEKRHACHDRVRDAALEKMSPKSVIYPEEPEKLPSATPEDGNGALEGTPAKGTTAKGEPTKTPSTAPVAGKAPAGTGTAPVAGKAPTTTASVVASEKPPRKPLSPAAQRAVIAMQSHLRCEGLLLRGAKRARMDMRTVAGLQIYQRLHMIADNGRIDRETRALLLADSREHDFRALLRALRERVVDATGLIEDGSSVGVLGEVQGRMLDSSEFQPLSVQATSAQSKPPSPGKARPQPVAATDKVSPAPDLIAAATQAASQALGWTSPEAVLASTLVVPPAPPPPSKRKRARRAAARPKLALLPAAVALRLPPLPTYLGPKMVLRAEIDRGEVVLKRPRFDKEGKKKWRPPVADRPTLTLYARVGEREVALMRWPTTIGGWKTIQRSDGTMALKYKDSATGNALWPEVLAGPTWHPGSGLPTRRLLVKSGDGWAPKTEVIGPGYRAAYGLVAIVHHQIEGFNERGEPQLVDHRIRTHGTPAYRSVKRGESSGCHRLHNHLAIRLAGFLVRHHAHVRDGLVPEDYVRRLDYKGQEVSLAVDNKGYRFALKPPIPVTVLEGDIRGNTRSVKYAVPMPVVP